MNILHIESSLNWGGQEHRTLAETRWLNAHGHRAWIGCNPRSELHRRARDVSLDVPMRASFDPHASLAIGSFCRRLAIDVVHVHSPKDAWICCPLHMAGVPVVRSRQITNPVKAQWSRSIIYRRGCAKIIATAECIRRDLIAFVVDRNPTVEHLAKLIFDYAASQNFPVERVTVWETPTSSAEYRRS